MDIKLTPDKYKDKSEKESRGGLGSFSSVKNISFWLKISIIVFVLVSLFGGALFGYQYYLKNQKEKLVQNISQIEGKRDKELENNLISLYNKSQTLQTLIENHVYSSRLFSMLEELVIPKAQLMDLSFDADKGVVSAGIKTEDYSSLAGQLSVLESDSRIEKVEFNKINLGKDSGAITSLEIFINTAFIKGPIQD